VCPFGVTTANRFFEIRHHSVDFSHSYLPLRPNSGFQGAPIIRHLRENNRLDRNGRLPRASITKGSPEVLSPARSFYEVVSMVVI